MIQESGYTRFDDSDINARLKAFWDSYTWEVDSKPSHWGKILDQGFESLPKDTNPQTSYPTWEVAPDSNAAPHTMLEILYVKLIDLDLV